MAKEKTKEVVQDNTQKMKALENAMKAIDKQFGKGSLMRMGDKDIIPIEAASTGSIGLDLALGIGGIPKGRIVEIYGPESSGKTTIALQTVADFQRKGGVAAFIDAEHALDPLYAQNIGVDVSNLLISQPDYGEQALDIVETLVQSGAVDIIVIDSVAALTPKSEIDGEMSEQNVGVQARMMSKVLRKITGPAHKNNVTIIFINQIRMKIGMMGYGSPETTSGGNALKFYASVRLDIRRIASLKQGEEQIGNRVKVKVIKNKVAPPFKQAEFDIMFGKGVNRIGEVIDYGVKFDIVDKSGSWFSYAESKLGQGRTNAIEFLRGNPELLKEIEEQVMEKLLGTNALNMAPDEIEEVDAGDDSIEE